MIVSVPRVILIYSSVILILCFVPALLRLTGSVSVSFLAIFTIPPAIVALFAASQSIRARVRNIFYISRFLFLLLSIMIILHLLSIFSIGGRILEARSLVALVNFVFLYSLFAIAFSYSDNKSRLIRIFVIAVAFSCSVAILQKLGFNLGGGYYAGDDRFSAFYAHPNQLGVVLACSFFVILYHASNTQLINSRYFFFPVILLLAIGLILSGSKSSILILAMMVSIYFLAGALRKPSSVLLLFLLFFLFAFLTPVLYDFLSLLNPRLFSVLSENSVYELMEYRTVEDRLGLWSYSMEIASNNPWTGEGLGNTIFGYFTHSHNLIFDYFRMFGYPGVLVCLLILYCLWLSARPLGNKLVFWGVLTYFLVNMLSDSMGPQTVFVLAFLLSMASSEYESLRTHGGAVGEC